MGEIFEKAASVAACIRHRGHARLRDEKACGTSHLRCAVSEIYHAPYFSRLWVKQEFILAKHIHLHCGFDTMPWHDLEELLPAQRLNPDHHSTSSQQMQFEKLRQHRSERAG